MMNTLALLIPAYRPSSVLLDLLDGVAAHDEKRLIGRVIVVDDGSGPGFAGIFERVARQVGVTVVRHAVNLGKGAALKTGFNHIFVNYPETLGVITADADGQHAVPDILRVAQRLAAEPDLLVLGVRGFDGSVPLRSRLGNTLTRYIFRLFTGLALSDTQTGLRGWPRPHCLQSLPVPINGYDFELECLMKANSLGAGPAGIVQVPIKTLYVDENRGSHFNPIRDSMRIYFVFLRYCGVSVLAAVLDSLVFYLTYTSTSNIALSQLFGRCVAVGVAFAIARNVVFRSDTDVMRSLLKYLGLVLIMGVVSYALINFLLDRFRFPPLAAKLIAEGLLFVANFAIQRELVFLRSEKNGTA